MIHIFDVKKKDKSHQNLGSSNNAYSYISVNKTHLKN